MGAWLNGRRVAALAVVAGSLVVAGPRIERAAAAPADIDVMVWKDVDGDGLWNPAFEYGLADVAVSSYDAAGVLVETVVTDANGQATLAGDTAVDQRVEVAAPPGLVPAPQGPDNGTTVQFARGGDWVSFGFQDPNNIIGETDDTVFVPIFAYGDPQWYDGSDPAYPADTAGGYAFEAPTAPNAGPPVNTTFNVPVGDVGAVYGSVRAPSGQSVFVSSYVKRHAGLGLGANGVPTTGGIYRVDAVGPDSAEGTLWADLDVLLPAAGYPGTGADPHPAPGEICTYDAFHSDGTPAMSAGPDHATCWLTDKATYGAVGKLGLGDLELSPARDALWTVNLASRQLVKVALVDEQQSATAADVTAFDLAPWFADCGYTYDDGTVSVVEDGTTDFRPFGLGSDARTGQMYLAVTCSGEHLHDAPGYTLRHIVAPDTIRTLVYSFDPVDPSGTMTKMIDDDLSTFTDGGLRYGNSTWTSDWRRDLSDSLCCPQPRNGAHQVESPRMVASDVVAVDGKLIVAQRDINADRWGTRTGPPVDQYTAPPHADFGGLFVAIAVSKQAVACIDPSAPAAGYMLERDGQCGAVQGARSNEFLDNWWSYFGLAGSFAVLANRPAGADLLATANGTPTVWYTSAAGTMRSSDGSFTDNTVRFHDADGNVWGPRFATNGVGALAELTSVEPRVELGSRVWYDNDGDGVQDAGEGGAPGVTVSLYDRLSGSAVLIGTTVTNTAGEYFFRSDSDISTFEGATPIPVSWTAAAGPAGQRIAPHDGSRYELRVDDPADRAPGGPLRGWVSTTADATGDAIDSDAPAGVAMPASSAAAQRGWFANDHTTDFGFAPVPALAVTTLINNIDASAAPRPYFVAGQTLTWQFVVTNVGAVTVDNVHVLQPLFGPTSCQDSTLGVGQQTQCITTSPAIEGAQGWPVTAFGGPPASPVSAQSGAYYFGVRASVGLSMTTNGVAAPAGPGPAVPAGSPVQWGYDVTNTSNVELTIDGVTDDLAGPASCPVTTLAAGASTTCTLSGTAAPGPHENQGTVTATLAGGSVVTATASSHYVGTVAGISIVAAVNGSPVADPPGPLLLAGDDVVISYEVINTGDVTVDAVVVEHDATGPVTCPQVTLTAGASMTCTGATFAAGAGARAVQATAQAASPTGATLGAATTAAYFGAAPAVIVVQSINGVVDAAAPGPLVVAGSPLVFTYTITNTGNVAVGGITLTTDASGAVACPQVTLEPGQSTTCTTTGTAVAGEYHNAATVVVQPPVGPALTVTQAAYYTGDVAAEAPVTVLTPAPVELPVTGSYPFRSMRMAAIVIVAGLVCLAITRRRRPGGVDR